MKDAKKGVGRGPTPGCNAIEWFVENESDGALYEGVVLKWEDWFEDPANEAEYVGVIDMCLEMHRLPAPVVTREDFVRDALQELAAES